MPKSHMLASLNESPFDPTVLFSVAVVMCVFFIPRLICCPFVRKYTVITASEHICIPKDNPWIKLCNQ